MSDFELKSLIIHDAHSNYRGIIQKPIENPVTVETVDYSEICLKCTKIQLQTTVDEVARKHSEQTNVIASLQKRA